MLQNIKKPIIIAHSGSMNQPEDTLDFMPAGYAVGAKGFEVDLNMTFDRVGVLSHDAEIPDDDGRIMDLGKITFKEAKARKKSLVTFEQAVEKAKEYNGLMNVDIKNLDVVPLALEIIEKMGFMENAYFTGIKLKYAEPLRRDFPKLRVAVNLKMTGKISPESSVLSEEARNATIKCKEIGAIGINVEHLLCCREWIDYAHKLNLITSCWTVDEAADMKEVISWGTDLITTNCPDRLSLILKGD